MHTRHRINMNIICIRTPSMDRRLRIFRNVFERKRLIVQVPWFYPSRCSFVELLLIPLINIGEPPLCFHSEIILRWNYGNCISQKENMVSRTFRLFRYDIINGITITFSNRKMLAIKVWNVVILGIVLLNAHQDLYPQRKCCKWSHCF